MQDTALVGMIDGAGDGSDQPGRSTEIRGEVAKSAIEALALHQLHAEVTLA